MSDQYIKRKIKCTNCGHTIAKGQLPALVEVKCEKCGCINDLCKIIVDEGKTKPFAERLKLEKK